jgi:DNA-binding response OmpR family regulator
MNTILIVEDDESYRSMLMYALESQGYKVFVAPGGLEAKNILQELKPNLIITDLIMEDMDGFEVIIHAKKQNPEIKIIAISGGGQLQTEKHLDTAKELGAEYSIMKPFSLDEITNAVDSLLK